MRNFVRWRHNLCYFTFPSSPKLSEGIQNCTEEGEKFLLFWLLTCLLVLWVVFINFTDESRGNGLSAFLNDQSYRLRLASRKIHEWWLQKHWDLPRPEAGKLIVVRWGKIYDSWVKILVVRLRKLFLFWIKIYVKQAGKVINCYFKVSFLSYNFILLHLLIHK